MKAHETSLNDKISVDKFILILLACLSRTNHQLTLTRSGCHVIRASDVLINFFMMCSAVKTCDPN